MVNCKGNLTIGVAFAPYSQDQQLSRTRIFFLGPENAAQRPEAAKSKKFS